MKENEWICRNSIGKTFFLSFETLNWKLPDLLRFNFEKDVYFLSWKVSLQLFIHTENLPYRECEENQLKLHRWQFIYPSKVWTNLDSIVILFDPADVNQMNTEYSQIQPVWWFVCGLVLTDYLKLISVTKYICQCIFCSCVASINCRKY